ncbi:MAG: thioredoxin family protein [Gammaproteobacteria bacterium]
MKTRSLAFRNNQLIPVLKYFLLFVSAILFAPSIWAEPDNYPVDWNDEHIPWHSYQEGMELARSENKPVMMIIYAEWCSTCHAYKYIFQDLDIVTASRQFIMVRVDADKYPELNNRFDMDGAYIPRTFMLHKTGNLMYRIYPDSSSLKFFIGADEPQKFIQLMQLALSEKSNSL